MDVHLFLLSQWQTFVKCWPESATLDKIHTPKWDSYSPEMDYIYINPCSDSGLIC